MAWSLRSLPGARQLSVVDDRPVVDPGRVMVAVALLPPTATMGMLFRRRSAGTRHRCRSAARGQRGVWIVAARLVFMAKGSAAHLVRAEQRHQSTLIYGLTWLVLKAVLLAIVYARHRYSVE